MTTISWNAPTATAIEIHVGSPTGTLFAWGDNAGSSPTGAWVMEGLTLYLQDVSGGKALTSANTLGTVILHVSERLLKASSIGFELREGRQLLDGPFCSIA